VTAPRPAVTGGVTSLAGSTAVGGRSLSSTSLSTGAFLSWSSCRGQPSNGSASWWPYQS